MEISGSAARSSREVGATSGADIRVEGPLMAKVQTQARTKARNAVNH